MSDQEKVEEVLRSVLDHLGSTETCATRAQEYAEEAENEAERAKDEAEEAGGYAESARDELKALLILLEVGAVTFSSQREAIVEELRVTMRNEIVHEVVDELQKLMSNKVISVLLGKGKEEEE